MALRPAIDRLTATDLAIILLACAFSYFYGLAAIDIWLWDESRIANNAIEMLERGEYIVTYFDGKPDHWNTKPPLLTWLAVLSMKAFGVSELSLRLPSAIAATLTTVSLYAFLRLVGQPRLTAIVAPLVLASTLGFSGIHRARTADFDSLLTLFVTLYMMAFFLYMEGGRFAGRAWVAAAGAVAVALAVMTKGIAGVMMLPAAALYLLWRGKLLAALRDPKLLAAGAFGLLVPLLYYWLRERADPGFVAAVVANELGGRFLGVKDANSGPWYYYLRDFALGPGRQWFPWIFAFPVALVFAMRSPDRKARALILFAAIAFFFFLSLISYASTKLEWYAAPLFPMGAIIIALGLPPAAAWARSLCVQPFRAVPVAALVAAICVVGYLPTLWRYTRPPERFPIVTLMRQAAASLSADRPIKVVHAGHTGSDGLPLDYPAIELFYARLLGAGERRFEIVSAGYAPRRGDVLLTCSGHAATAPDAVPVHVLLEPSHAECAALRFGAPAADETRHVSRTR